MQYLHLAFIDCTHQGGHAELQEYKLNAEEELRSLRAKSAAHDSLNNHVLTATEAMYIQVETLKVQECVCLSFVP